MVRQPHRLLGHKYEQTLGDSEGQGSLACCSPWGCNELNTTQQLNNKNNKFPQKRVRKFWKSLFPLKTILKNPRLHVTAIVERPRECVAFFFFFSSYQARKHSGETFTFFLGLQIWASYSDLKRNSFVKLKRRSRKSPCKVCTGSKKFSFIYLLSFG